MTLQKKTYRKTADILFLTLFALGILFRIWKAVYGFHYYDETYYYSTAYRLLQGDAFLAEDWDFTQFSLVSLYPFVKAYCRMTGGTEGLIVAGRYFFIFVHSVCTAGVYLLLRKKSPVKAICASAVYFLYAQWYCSEQSYYQIFMDMLLISMLIIASDAGSRRRTAAGGYFFAVSVLACPYAAAAYLLYTVLCVILKISGNEKEEMLNIKAWLHFTGGCAAAAAVFLLFTVCNSDIGKIIEVLPMYFGDSTHPIGFSAEKTKNMLLALLENLKITDFVLLAGLLAEAADKKRTERRKLYAPVLLAAALFGTAAEIMSAGSENENIALRLCIIGLNSYLLCREKDRKLLFTVWGFGWILGICLFYASDMQWDVLLMTGWIMSAMAGICFVIQLVSEMLHDGTEKKPLKLCLLFLCTSLIVIQTGLEIRGNIPGKIWELYCPLTYGIGKGEIISEAELVYEQERLWNATEKVRQADGDYVLYFSEDYWPYLEDTKRCASYNVWMQTEDDINMAEKLLKYWELFPEKKPDAIYVTKNNEHPLEVIEIVNTENFPVEENDSGYVMIRPTKG